MNLINFLSIISDKGISIEPAIFDRIPRSLYSSLKEIPDFPLIKDSFISLIFLPIGEIAPMPVITTLFFFILKTRGVFE